MNRIPQSRRTFLRNASVLAAALPVAEIAAAESAASLNSAPKIAKNIPEVLLADSRLRLKFHPETLILEQGVQPSMLCTSTGALIVQSQLPSKPHPQSRIFYPF